MKILVTGFDPFGGESVNPAYEAVKLLPDVIGGAEIFKLEIPTVFSLSGPAVEEGIRKYQPDVVICIRDDTSFVNFEGNGQVAP